MILKLAAFLGVVVVLSFLFDGALFAIGVILAGVLIFRKRS